MDAVVKSNKRFWPYVTNLSYAISIQLFTKQANVGLMEEG